MKKIKILLILLVFLCSIAVVSAEDTNTTDVVQLADETSLDQETNIILQTDDEINDDTTTQGDILGASSPGTFRELQRIIDSTPEGNWFSIDKDYYADEDLKTLTIDKSITFYGNGHTLDGKALDRIMDVSLNSEQAVVLKNLNFINGKLGWTSGAGLYISGGEVTVTGCAFKENQGGSMVTGAGGAIYAKNCELKVLNSVFDHNHFDKDDNWDLLGGAIGVKGGSCFISDSVFQYNVGGKGSAIWADAPLNVERCDFISNVCQLYGAIYSENNAEIKRCNFIGNKATDSGTSICISADDGISRIESCNFIGDTADDADNQHDGNTINVVNQKIMQDGATVFINNCTFADQPKDACIVSNYRAESVFANNNWWGNTDQNKNEKPKVKGNVVVDDWYYLSFNKTYYMPNGKTLIELSLKSAKDDSQKDIPSIYAINNIKATNAQVTQTDKYTLYYEPSSNSDKGSVELTLTQYSYNHNPFKFDFIHDVKVVTVHNYDELADALENSQKQVAPNCIIDLAEGNYTATRNIVLRNSEGLKNLVINGNNNVLDGKGLYSFLMIGGLPNPLNGLKLTISDATFKNFHSENDGSVLQMFMGYGEATLNNVKFIDNAARNGGALALAVLTNVNINNCEFTKNSATADGGAVYVDSQNFNIKDTTFTQNNAKNKGGAVYDSVKTTAIDNSEFLENTARLGGALYYARGTVTATNSKFIRNVATEDAGAVYRNGPFYGDDNVFQDNSPNDFEYTGSAEGDDINPPSDSGYSGSSTGYEAIDKITVGNRQIPIKDNKLTLGILNQIFNKDFRNGHLLVYIDGKLIFNATTTDNLTQFIIDLLSLLLGKHEIKVVFTDNKGNTNTYTENITI